MLNPARFAEKKCGTPFVVCRTFFIFVRKVIYLKKITADFAVSTMLATLQTKKNMSDQIIFDVDGLIEAQIRQRDKDYAKVCCQNLLNYAYGKGLLCDNPCDNEGNLIMPSIIKESSLTEIGKHIFVELLFKWFAYTDNESGKIDRKNNIKMLEKYYNQLLQKIDRK